MEQAKLLCLDLDGTIRRSKSGKTFISDLDDVELIPNVKNAIKEYYNKGYLICIATNQGGVAFGYKTLEDVEKEILQIMEMLLPEIEIFAAGYCPVMENGTVPEVTGKSLFRKPNIGMLVTFEQKVAHANHTLVDWDNSLFVGDRKEDEECAKNANIPFKYIDKFIQDYENNNKTN